MGKRKFVLFAAAAGLISTDAGCTTDSSYANRPSRASNRYSETGSNIPRSDPHYPSMVASEAQTGGLSGSGGARGATR